MLSLLLQIKLILAISIRFFRYSLAVAKGLSMKLRVGIWVTTCVYYHLLKFFVCLIFRSECD